MAETENKDFLDQLWKKYATGKLSRQRCLEILGELDEDPDAFFARETLESSKLRLEEKHELAPSPVINVYGSGNVIGDHSSTHVTSEGGSQEPCAPMDDATALACYLDRKSVV